MNRAPPGRRRAEERSPPVNGRALAGLAHRSERTPVGRSANRRAWPVLRAGVIIYSHREHRILPGTVARDLLTDADALGNLTVRRTIGSSICSFVSASSNPPSSTRSVPRKTTNCRSRADGAAPRWLWRRRSSRHGRTRPNGRVGRPTVSCAPSQRWTLPMIVHRTAHGSPFDRSRNAKRVPAGRSAKPR